MGLDTFFKSLGMIELDCTLPVTVGGERNEKIICKYIHLAIFNIVFVRLRSRW